MHYLLVAVFTCLFTAPLQPEPPQPDVFELTDGGHVRGQVVKETDANIFVDVGYTILEIPTANIVSRTEGDSEPADPESNADSDSISKGLYTTGNLTDITVQDAVKRFGSGVVVVRTPGGLGSGFIIREDGYLVTNAHVVQGEIEFTVIVYQETEDGFEKKLFENARLVAVNPFIDLALVKIDEEDLGDVELTRVVLGDINKQAVGEPVFAIGAPLGMDRSVSEGIISIKNRSHEGKVYVQTTAAINPGNSGGPLFNSKGEVIAVNTLGYMFAEGMNLSIPVDYVKHFIENRDAFAYDRGNPNSGYRYLAPPERPKDDPQP
ncbi:MAG: trypsin-like peptidase domain-containing protein [Planctomycetota bacterium]|nr:trypsin-like peptidase domain-containing protein [Planctomycetota bacterium]